jgi:general secretion pathway protein A
MYESFFGLDSSPFQLSPDPFFMIPSEKSEEALASISYAIRQRKGFVVLTGEVGTGKTLLLRCLIEFLEREEISFAYFIGPRLSAVDFLSYIAFELGLDVTEHSKGDLLRALYVFLLAQFEKGRTTVLIIDEAHQMPRSVLEEIRLLTNFETAQQKLVQIILVGQPELDERLDLAELRSLKQRISVRCRLEPLREEEIRPYIERRLQLAGADSQAITIFPAEAIREIYRYSHGIPRLVNSICDQALIAAYARQVRVVPVEFINDVASHFRLDPTPNLEQPVTPLFLENKVQSAVQDESLRAFPPLPAAGEKTIYPDPTSSNLYIAKRTPPAKMIPSSNAEASDERSVRDNCIPYKPNLKQEEKAIITSEKVSPASTQNSTLTPESIFPARTAVTALQPEIGQTTQSAVNPRAISQADEISRHTEPFQIRFKLQPRLRMSLIIGVLAAAPVALATGYFVARHQAAGVTAQAHRVVDTTEPFPIGQKVLSMQPVEAGSAVKVDVSSAHLKGIRTDSPTTPPTDRLIHSAPPSKGVTGILSKPVRKSSPLSVPTEPLSITEIQTKELDLGKGVLGASVLSPTRPSANVVSNLQPPKPVWSPAPNYPSIARVGNVGGAVLIDAVVDETGKVSDMKVISGDPVLRQAAMEGLRMWKYQPARLNGQPTAAHVQVRIDFVPH